MSNAPRYRLVGYDIGTAPDENGGWVHWTDHEAIVAKLTAERDSAIRAKDCFQRMTRAHWEALCAMRNSINEYIQMPNTDSGPLFSPEDGPIYADIAERVIADLTESRAYALALEQELRDRAEKAEAERDAALAGAVKVKPLVWEPHPFSQSTIEECAIADAPFKQRYQIQRDPWATTYIAMLYPRIPISDSTLWWESKGHADMASAREAAQADYEARILAALPPDPDARQADLAKAAITALHDIDDLVANSEGVSGLHLNGNMAPWSEIMDGGAYGAWLQSVERLREAIRALLPPADLAAKIGGEE